MEYNMMNKSNILRHIAGFTVGFSLFYLFIPFCFFMVSKISFIQILALPDQIWINILCIGFAVIGMFFALASNLMLVMIGKGGPTEGLGVAISPKTQHIVTKGVYKYTRNPMVFGTFSCYFAFALYLKSGGLILFIFLLLPLFLGYLKKSEENRMFRDFGEEYMDYKKRVSFFFPWPPVKI
jgi:protein-S-isoprenylcysteine O-methyltransferase Ste14